jgi:hypothetical protein
MNFHYNNLTNLQEFLLNKMNKLLFNFQIHINTQKYIDDVLMLNFCDIRKK